MNFLIVLYNLKYFLIMYCLLERIFLSIKLYASIKYQLDIKETFDIQIERKKNSTYF